MRVPLKWLAEYVDVVLPPAELARRLSMAGNEVGRIDEIGADWRNVVVGQVLSVERHPRADNLFVVQVDLGPRAATLVTAATNLAPGLKVPVVLPGGGLAPGQTVEAREFRGVRSEGMLCSGDELGISPDKERIYVLEPEAPVGVALREYLGDVVLDIEVTPNRPDTLSIVGVAREVAALTGRPLRFPEIEPPSGGPPVADQITVEIRDPDLCPRYSAAVIADLTVRPSPHWMQRRLYACGVRPINNLVDVTNYVMLELGQPLHAFDGGKLQGGIVVRRAAPGERLVTIDGVERALDPTMLVIADRARPQAIAGIMGGLDSEVGDETRTVVLESANFEPRAIRQTSRALRMATEASKRFDKGLDPEMTVVAAARAAALMVELGGGVAATGLVDVYPGVAPPREVVVTPGQIAGLLGRRYEVEEIERVLTNLQFGVERADGALRVRVPTFRRDVVGKADIAEEVARITGYDQIPPALPKGQLPPPRRDLTRHWEEVVKATLVGCGYQEVITYSLVDPLATQKLDAAAPWPNVEPRGDMVAVYNPMSVEQSFLRTSLLPSLLATLAANLRHAERVYLFELARVYLPPLEPLPRERRRLGIVFCGDRYPTGWDVPHAPGDFFDLKGAIEEVLEALRVRDATFRPAVHPSLHPGRTAELAAVDATGHERSLGFLGQVHPRVAERFDLEGREVYAAEIDFDDLLLFASEELTVRPLPRFPAVALDIAVVVDEDVPHRRVEREVREAGGSLLEAVRLFDVYRGAPVPAGRKSLAYALTFRAPDRTLTEAEALEVRERIVQRLREQVGATIRGQDHA